MIHQQLCNYLQLQLIKLWFTYVLISWRHTLCCRQCPRAAVDGRWRRLTQSMPFVGPLHVVERRALRSPSVSSDTFRTLPHTDGWSVKFLLTSFINDVSVLTAVFCEYLCQTVLVNQTTGFFFLFLLKRNVQYLSLKVIHVNKNVFSKVTNRN